MQIPTYDAPTVTPQNAPQVGANAPRPPVTSLLGGIPLVQSPRAMPDVTGRMLQEQGADAMQAGGALSSLATAIQADINQTRVANSLNKVQRAATFLQVDPAQGFANIKGEDALNRPSKQDLTTEFSQALAAYISEEASSLGNTAQREEFMRHADAVLNGFQGRVAAHQATEYSTYKQSVAKGSIDTLANLVALSPDDPENGTRVDAIRHWSRELARLQGKSAKEADAAASATVSKAHRMAIAGLVESGQYGQADEYLTRNRKQMEAGDLVPAKAAIQEKQSALQADAIAHEVTAGSQPVSDIERAYRVATIQESGGRQLDKNGNVITSPKGARGIGQIMPGTWEEARKLAGLPATASINNADDNYAAGIAYFKKQVETFNGDLDKAWAAYNMGPGSAQKGNGVAGLVAKYGADWLAHAPKETQGYVAANRARYNAGAGQVAPMSTLEVQDKAEQRLLQDRPNASPEERQQVRAAAAQRHSGQRQATQQQEQQAIADAWTWGENNDWKWGDMPASIKMSIPADRKLGMANIFDKQAQGEPVKTDLAEWGRFIMMDRNTLAQYTPESFIASFHDKFSPEKLDSGLSIIRAARNQDPQSAAFLSTRDMIQSSARKAGVLPWKGAPDESQVQNFDAIEQVVNERIKQEESLDPAGKKLAPEKIQSIIDGVMIDNVTRDRRFWFDDQKLVTAMTPDELARAYVTVGKDNVRLSEIPTRAIQQITVELQRRGMQPTQQNIATAWIRATKQ